MSEPRKIVVWAFEVFGDVTPRQAALHAHAAMTRIDFDDPDTASAFHVIDHDSMLGRAVLTNLHNAEVIDLAEDPEPPIDHG